MRMQAQETPPFIRAMLAAARRRAALAVPEGSLWPIQIVVCCVSLEHFITQEQLDALIDRLAQNGLDFSDATQDESIYEFLSAQVKRNFERKIQELDRKVK